MEKKELIEAGRIVNTHGVRGEVKIENWLDSPQFLKNFKRLVLDTGEERKVVEARTHKDFVIARLEGVEDVNAAMRLKGKTVSVHREDAKLPAGAFFLQDIIGARVVDELGNEIGKLAEIIPNADQRLILRSREQSFAAVWDQDRLIAFDAPAVPSHPTGAANLDLPGSLLHILSLTFYLPAEARRCVQAYRVTSVFD